MGLFDRPKSRRAHRRTKTWLDKQAEQSGDLIEKVKNLPRVRAAIIQHAIGVRFHPDELETMDPQAFFHLRAIKKLGLDKEFPFVVNENAFFDLFAPTGSRTRRRKREAEFTAADSFGEMIPLQPENDDEQTYYRPRLPLYPTRPRRYTNRRIPGSTVFRKPSTGKTVDDLARQVRDVVTPVKPIPSRIYAVEVDGKWVEMTEDEYQLFDQKRKAKQQPPGPPPSEPLK